MSIVKRLENVEVESLYSGANSSIWRSHARAHDLAKKAAREEDFVATLVTDGVPLLEERWRKVLGGKGIDVQVAGVFCHGHPQVEFDYPNGRVELADLLVVHRHSEGRSDATRAMLIQAKMSVDGTHKLDPKDPQLTLYTTWPNFEFVTGGLKTGLRQINEKGKGSRYSLVLAREAYPEDIEWADQCPWSGTPAAVNLTASRSLSKCLGDMLLGKDGRLVHFGSSTDQWSMMIKELLEVTATRTYSRRNIGREDVPRGTVSAGAMHFSGQLGLLQIGEKKRHPRSLINRFFGSVPVKQNGDGGNQTPIEKRVDLPEGGISSLIIQTMARG
ncbi:hypothetical protein LIG30_2825 [Burkholderia sp. lig30]|uniref:hypothetical protein n=1 Tax=Burkholderia sp. lig30 TaxID=1192124 RepID=UPI000460B0F9|nr:hypothetical protein [Burkholderia sp. lig30]KDB08026.1 hypothetical protein LIG30_2825 [Burkholderia sp. lig30]